MDSVTKASNTRKNRRSTPKKKRDGPKRPMSAFFLYMGKRRTELIAEKPELKSNVREIGKLVGDEWKSMSEDEKATYVELANKDKLRYQEEMESKKTGKQE